MKGFLPNCSKFQQFFFKDVVDRRWWHPGFPARFDYIHRPLTFIYTNHMVSCCLYVQSTHNTRRCTVNAIKKCYSRSLKKRIFTLFNFLIFDQAVSTSLGIYDEGNRCDQWQFCVSRRWLDRGLYQLISRLIRLSLVLILSLVQYLM